MALGLISQDEFYEYIRRLPPDEGCRFLVRVGIALCDNEKFMCPYKGSEVFTVSRGQRRECKREDTLRIKKLLG